MPVTPDLRRNERQISDEKKRQIAVDSSEILQNWTAILRFVENSTEILLNGLPGFCLPPLLVTGSMAAEPFRFAPRRGKLKWRAISMLDLDRVQREVRPIIFVHLSAARALRPTRR
eukprot:scaffold11326_cov101-Isochrysis_galbana.AAC.4